MEQFNETKIKCNDKVKDYFETNWANIPGEFIQNMMPAKMNLGIRTTNRVESYWSHLKSYIKRKDNINSFIVHINKYINRDKKRTLTEEKFYITELRLQKGTKN
jgi:hypothetical protein